MFDVLCVGFAVFDITMAVDYHPGSDEKCFARQMVSCGGGPAANASVTVASLGGSAALAAYLGNDFGGNTHLTELRDAGVGTDFIIRGDAATPVSAILVKPDGNRTVVNYKGETAWLPADASSIPVELCKAVLFDGHEPLLSAAVIKKARKHNIPVVLDAGSLHRGTEELAGMVDYLVASEKFAAQYTGNNSPLEALSVLKKCAPHVVITLGSDGLIWAAGEKKGAMKAFTIEAVDTTGAGDVFHGCFTLGAARHMDFIENLRRSSAAAALCCTRRGARTAIPARSELETFLS